MLSKSWCLKLAKNMFVDFTVMTRTLDAFFFWAGNYNVIAGKEGHVLEKKNIAASSLKGSSEVLEMINILSRMD
jgi:hypothetical protein